MNIPHLLQHPEELDQETLYDLRRIVAVYPTYHAARILFLQNLFLLHDPTFDQELRRAALLVPDRRVLFNITQPLEHTVSPSARPTSDSEPETSATLPEVISETPAAETSDETLATPVTQPATQASSTARPSGRTPKKKYVTNDSTSRLLDGFLSTTAPLQKRRIKADPASDYMAYILENDESFGEETATTPATSTPPSAASSTSSTTSTPAAAKPDRMQSLIDAFINSYTEGGITLSEEPEVPEEATTESDVSNDPTLTETLANVYIQQQKYERAIEVLTKSQPKAQRNNPYLADQVRFLQKLAINERHKAKGKR